MTASKCCDRKARAACAQSFTLCQQATIEITRRDHSIIACSFHVYMGVVLRAHSVRGEPRIQRNGSGKDATEDLDYSAFACGSTKHIFTTGFEAEEKYD